MPEAAIQNSCAPEHAGHSHEQTAAEHNAEHDHKYMLACAPLAYYAHHAVRPHCQKTSTCQIAIEAKRR